VGAATPRAGNRIRHGVLGQLFEIGFAVRASVLEQWHPDSSRRFRVALDRISTNPTIEAVAFLRESYRGRGWPVKCLTTRESATRRPVPPTLSWLWSSRQMDLPDVRSTFAPATKGAMPTVRNSARWGRGVRAMLERSPVISVGDRRLSLRGNGSRRNPPAKISSCPLSGRTSGGRPPPGQGHHSVRRFNRSRTASCRPARPSRLQPG
jgi:hypothetical protein